MTRQTPEAQAARRVAATAAAIAELARNLRAEGLEATAGFLVLVATRPVEARQALAKLSAALDAAEAVNGR